MDTLSRDSGSSKWLKAIVWIVAAGILWWVGLTGIRAIRADFKSAKAHLYTVTQYSATGTEIGRWEHVNVIAWTTNCHIDKEGSRIVVTPPYVIVEEKR